MTAPFRLRPDDDDETGLSDADLWEKKVREGLPKDAATQYVQRRAKPPQPKGSTRDFGPEQPSFGRDALTFANQFAHGGTMGLASHIAGALESMRTGEPREAIVAREKAEREEFAKRHPKLSLTGEVAGSFALPIGAFGAAGGGFRGLMAGAATGAAASGITAAADAEPGKRADAAKVGTVAGGVLGAAIPIVGVPAGRAVGRIASSDAAQEAAKRFATSKLGQGIADKVRRVVPGLTPQERADEILFNALTRAGLEPAEAAARSSASAKPVGLLDVGGNEMQKVARAARTAGGGVARDLQPALVARTEGQVARIGDDLAAKTGLSRPEWEQALEELIDARSRNAKPLYQRAYQFGEVKDEQVRQLVQELYEDAPDLLEEIYGAAAQSAKLKDRTRLPGLFVEREVMHNGKKIKIKELGPLTVETLDHMKKGLDAVIEKKAGTEKAIPKLDATSLRGRLNAILDRLDDVVTDEQGERIYAKARAQFKGDSELKDAFEAGGEFLKLKPAEVRYRLSKMSDGEKALFRRRALDTLLGRAEDAADNADATKVIGGSVSKRGRLQELFADEAEFKAFQDLLKQEADMFRAQQFITGGSPTADKLAELADLAGVDLGDLLMGGKPTPTNLLLRGAEQMWRKAGQGYTRTVSDKLAPSLTAGLDGNKQAVEDVIQRLLENAEIVAAKRRAAARGSRGLAQTIGSKAGGQ